MIDIEGANAKINTPIATKPADHSKKGFCSHHFTFIN